MKFQNCANIEYTLQAEVYDTSLHQPYVCPIGSSSQLGDFQVQPKMPKMCSLVHTNKHTHTHTHAQPHNIHTNESNKMGFRISGSIDKV